MKLEECLNVIITRETGRDKQKQKEEEEEEEERKQQVNKGGRRQHEGWP